MFEGEILGVIGPNGAGKSTTFNLIAGAFPATAGEVRFAGEPILGLPPHKIAARGVMRTFQHNRPFPGMSVLENVLVGAHTRFHAGMFFAKSRNRRAERRAARGGADRVRRAGRRASMPTSRRYRSARAGCSRSRAPLPASHS